MKTLNRIAFFFIIIQFGWAQNIKDLAYPNCDLDLFNSFKDYSITDLSADQAYNFGKCYLINGQYEQALDNFNLALEKGFKDEVALDYYLARSYAGLKNHEKSNYYLDKALLQGLGYEIFFRTPEWDMFRYTIYKNIIKKYGINVGIWDVFFLLVSLFSFLLFVYFLKLFVNSNKPPLLFMSLFILTFSITLFEYFLFWTGYIYLSPIRGIFAPLFFLFAPMLYLYIKFVINAHNNLRKTKYWFHFIPFLILFMIFVLPKIFIIDENPLLTLSIKFLMFSIVWLRPIQVILYVIAIIYLLFRNSDEIESTTRKWMIMIFVFIVLVFICLIVPFFLTEFDFLSQNYGYFFSFIVTILVCLIAVMSYIQPKVFMGKSMIEAVVEKVKYKNSGLTEGLIIELKENLIELFEKDKVYLENDLTLLKLSKMLDSDRYSVSQIINQGFGKNFYAFVNDYRVKEAVKIFKDAKGRHPSIADIAYQTGFNNRVSFNKAFKKRMGKAPYDYISDLLK